MIYRIKKRSMQWNPIKTGYRNEMCPCGSGARYKTCCQPKILHVLPKSVVYEMSTKETLKEKYLCMFEYTLSFRMRVKMFKAKVIRFIYKYFGVNLWMRRN